jgi:hypothetical protein
VAIARTSAVLFGRLLEITSLARTAIDLQLTHAAAARTDDLEVARAFDARRDLTGPVPQRPFPVPRPARTGERGRREGWT